MIGTIDVCPQTYSPDFPLDTLKSFVNSPSSIRIRNVPKKVGKWRITNVFVTVAYPDNTTRTIECVLTGGVYVATFEGCSSTGKVEKGLTISANGKDENDNDVTGYVLGKGDVEILEARENTSPGETVYYIHLLEDEPDVPTDGDMYKKDGNYVVYQNGVETQLGVSQENMESYVDQKVEEVEGEIPTKTSDLTNDSNFITSEQVEPSVLTGYAENAHFAVFLYNLNNGVVCDKLNVLMLPDGQPTVESTQYNPWKLTKWYNDTFSKPLQLEFKYIKTIEVPLFPGMPLPTNKTINQYGWIGSSDALTHYIIKAEKTNPNVDMYYPTAMGKFDSTSSDFKPITITSSTLSIETVDGQSGVVTCTRTGTNTHITRPLAYRDELSSYLPLDKINSDPELGYATFPYSLTLHKPLSQSQELYNNPTVFVGVGSSGNTENVVELCDTTKNEIMFGFNSDGVPQTKWGYDEEWNNVLTWPQQGGTIATKEWVEERLAQLLSQLQS